MAFYRRAISNFPIFHFHLKLLPTNEQGRKFSMTEQPPYRGTRNVISMHLIVEQTAAAAAAALIIR